MSLTSCINFPEPITSHLYGLLADSHSLHTLLCVIAAGNRGKSLNQIRGTTLPLTSAGSEMLDARGVWVRGGEGYARHTCPVCHTAQANMNIVTPNPAERSLPLLKGRFWFSWVKRLSQAPPLTGRCWHGQKYQSLLRSFVVFSVLEEFQGWGQRDGKHRSSAASRKGKHPRMQGPLRSGKIGGQE